MVTTKRSCNRKLAISKTTHYKRANNKIKNIPISESTPNADTQIQSASPISYKDPSTSPKEHKFVPPRSKELFRVGPEFQRTCQNFQLSDPAGTPLYTIISARIDRGFQRWDNDSWLSYRRNYFALAVSFSIVEKDKVELGKVPPYPVQVIHGDFKSRVQTFAIRLTAFRMSSNGEAEEIPLIQHTPKRNKGPRQPPPIVPAVPGVLPDHDFMRDNANFRSSAQLRKVEPYFYRSKSLLGPFTHDYSAEKVAHVVLFDRVQFATAGGGACQECKAVVQLIVTLDDAVSYVVAWCETPSFTLRNRSPGNYYDDGTLIPRSRKGRAESANDYKRKISPSTEQADKNVSRSGKEVFSLNDNHMFKSPMEQSHQVNAKEPNFDEESKAKSEAVLIVSEKRKRGRPKSVKQVLETVQVGKQKEEPIRRRTRRSEPEPALEPPKKKVRGLPNKLEKQEALREMSSHITQHEITADSDEDSDDFEESEEEMKKRDLMRLRSGPMHLGSASQGKFGNHAVAAAPSFEIMGPSIGRARPSADRGTYGPSTTSNGNQSTR